MARRRTVSLFSVVENARDFKRMKAWDVLVYRVDARSHVHVPHWRTKNEKSKDYCKADLRQRVLFFITIFRLAIPAFFRFTDVTELM